MGMAIDERPRLASIDRPSPLLPSMPSSLVAPAPPVVLVEHHDGIACVTLNRPAQMNAVSQALRDLLIPTLNDLNHDDTVQAIVITGKGERAFCAGQDLAEAAALQPDDIVPWLNSQRTMYQAVRNLDKPCVAALNGVTAGAGFQIALCADWRIAHEDARIGQPEVKAGLGSIVGSYLMSLYVGLNHNAQLSLSGDLVSARRAHEMGLITALSQGDVRAEAIDCARQLAQRPTTAFRETKRFLRTLTQPGFDAAAQAGIAAQQACFAAGEPQAAMARFRK